ncbi:MAG TPA: Crp/Fnr family transcriptional regulator [Aggregatilineales bacterium]|nr:Crp/Fnr family transcriptional regulator [Aggregatilineales bacterium]
MEKRPVPQVTALTHAWIARVPLFIPLCGESQAAIDREIHVRKYEKGQPIVLEGHRPTGLCIVVSGLVRIYRMMADGRVHVHHYLRPYAPFNVIPALDGRPNPTSAEAVIESQVGWLSREALIALMSRDADLMQACLRLLTLQNRQLMARIDDLGFRTVPSRLARLLLHSGGFETEVNIPLDTLSQDEIAAVLGTSREVLGRALRQLYDMGLVRREGRSYVIVDREGLERLGGE